MAEFPGSRARSRSARRRSRRLRRLGAVGAVLLAGASCRMVLSLRAPLRLEVAVVHPSRASLLAIPPGADTEVVVEVANRGAADARRIIVSVGDGDCGEIARLGVHERVRRTCTLRYDAVSEVVRSLEVRATGEPAAPLDRLGDPDPRGWTAVARLAVSNAARRCPDYEAVFATTRRSRSGGTVALHPSGAVGDATMGQLAVRWNAAITSMAQAGCGLDLSGVRLRSPDGEFGTGGAMDDNVAWTARLGSDGSTVRGFSVTVPSGAAVSASDLRWLFASIAATDAAQAEAFAPATIAGRTPTEAPVSRLAPGWTRPQGDSVGVLGEAKLACGAVIPEVSFAVTSDPSDGVTVSLDRC
ncbi:MAG: hypothetical protein R2698_13455 [Microthrixaceae bacterium]